MHRWIFFSVAVSLCPSLSADDAPTLRQIAAGQAKIVDLTYTLNERSPYWPGDKYQPFELRTIATLEEDGVLSKMLILPEHLGTHIDAPNHFEADRPAVDDLFRRVSPDLVVHFAAESHVDRSIHAPDAFVRTNIIGTFNLLEAARAVAAEKATMFHHVSTDEVYGSLGPTGAFVETTPYDPSSPYSASKASSDHLVRAYHRTYGLPVRITNCSNNYGPCQFPEKLIPLTILNALDGKPLPVYGQGTNVRDWLYVVDHCEAIWAVVQRGRIGETYNIGGRAEMRNIDVVKAICHCVAAETCR